MYTVEYKAPLYKTMEELDDFFSDIAAVEKKADAAKHAISNRFLQQDMQLGRGTLVFY